MLFRSGKAVRTTHWIIELEAPIDVTALLRANDDETALLDAGEAARVLEGLGNSARPEGDDSSMVDIGTRDAKSNEEDAAARSGNATAHASRASVQQSTSTIGSHSAGARHRKPTASPGEAAASVEQVLAAAGAFGIDATHYETYAARRWGTGWKLNANGRRRALDEIERYRNDPDGLVDKIDVELQACS